MDEKAYGRLSQSGSVPNTHQSRHHSGSADVIDFEIAGKKLRCVACEMTRGEELPADASSTTALSSRIEKEFVQARSAKLMIFGGEGAYVRGCAVLETEVAVTSVLPVGQPEIWTWSTVHPWTDTKEE